MSKADFKKHHNELTEQLRLAKSKYFKEQFDLHANNIKKTWDVINSAIKSKKVRSSISLTDDDGLSIDESHIPSKFIDHYTTIAQKLACKVPDTPSDYTSHLKDRIEKTFALFPVIPNEINPIIDNLKDNGRTANSIATSVLIESKQTISPILCHLINLFTQQGYFPDNLKLGCITPIFKNGDREKVVNYRPVCTLSPLSKIFEKIVNNRMIDFIDKNNIFSKSQFGFRKNMGTEDALMDYINHLQSQLNSSKYTISIFLDLSKAFDVIDHKILEAKLYHYGFRGKILEFLMCFTKDRKYFVNINGRKSQVKTVNTGVPQGSTLGPLLFLLYINDMVNCSKLFLTQYADDSTTTHSSTNLAQTISTVEKEFEKILNWLADNKLIINLDKTHLMLFTYRARPLEPITITVKGHTITEIKETKFLGIMLDNKLTWNAHIDHISKKVSKSVSLLRMLKHSFPSRILKSIYHSLIYPYFNYGNIIWGAAATTLLDPLRRLQRKCIRIICSATFDAPTGILFKRLNLLNIDQIYDFKCANFIYCTLNNIKYTLFKESVHRNGSFHSYSTRSRDQLRPNHCRLTRFFTSFINYGMRKWNVIPANIKSAKSVYSFKRKLKKYFINQHPL